MLSVDAGTYAYIDGNASMNRITSEESKVAKGPSRGLPSRCLEACVLTSALVVLSFVLEVPVEGEGGEVDVCWQVVQRPVQPLSRGWSRRAAWGEGQAGRWWFGLLPRR
jgi:hypothetical protein